MRKVDGEWVEEETFDLEARQLTRTRFAKRGDHSLAWLEMAYEGEMVQEDVANGGYYHYHYATRARELHRLSLERAQGQDEVRPCVSLLDCVGSGTNW